VLADNDPYPDVAEYRPGEGAIGIAYQSREGFIVDDYASWPHATPLGKASGVRKVAAVPLMVGDQALGSLAVYGYTSLGMGNRHLQLLSLLASQVAPVLQGAELLDSSQRQARVFRALHELAVAASGVLEPSRVARLAVEHVRAVLNADRAVVSQWDADEGHLKVLAEDDVTGAIYPTSIEPSGGGVLQRSFQLVETIVVDDYQTWEHAVPLARRRGMRSAMAVPLLAREGPIGAIAVSTVTPRHFGPDDVQALSLLAAQLTPTLQAARLHASLAESERDFRAIFDTSPLAIARFDLSGRIVEANKAYARLFRARAENLRGRAREELIHLDDLQLDEEWFKELVTGRREQYRLERRYRKLDGTDFWADVTHRLVRDAAGKPEFYYLMLDDVTERKRVEAARRESEERFRAVFDRAAIAILRLDLGGRIMEANPTVQRMLGHGNDELVGTPFMRIVHPEDRNPRQFTDLLHARVDEAQLELRYLHKYGVGVWGNTIGSVVRDQHGAPLFVIVMVEDITVRKVQEQALEHRALHDALTDLPNRTLLNDRLHQAILAGRRDEESVALLVMDLDRFKEVNDAFGHHSGDILLQQVALRLREELRGSDTVARLGGDEFAVVLPSIGGLPGAARAARKILRALEPPFTVERETVDIGASVGIALFPDHGEDADTLLRRADVAMYAAKRSGAGFAFYAVEHDTHSPSRLAMLAELRHAIEQGSLMLHYQPKIELRSRRIVGAEALVRWDHPTLGLMMPDDFIPLAEHTGLIRPLGLWVIDVALRQSKAWQRAGIKIKLALNLSMRNLHDPQLLDTFERLIKRHHVDPGSLQVEITESALMADPEHSTRVLNALEEMGIRLAVDDYGTGYSSLAYLRRLPVEELKIDKSFVSDMTREENSAVIVRSTIELGHNLGLVVTAEGVEDRPTVEMLSAERCDLAQGYFFSQPLSVRELNRLLKAQTLRVLEA
jgi:diguanylate cyclase (GGDEF)-like protein/PAS domain S-box-containing protein